MRKISKIIKFLWRKLKNFFEYTKYYLLYPVAFLKYKGKEIYLVSERGTDARDNGYHFYCFLKKNYPELESYYVIDKKSVDYNKVSSFGNIIQYRSLKHYLIFIAAKYKISTHIMGFSPNMPFYTSFNIKHRLKGKLVFLQHGVIQNNLIGLYKQNTNVDLFICGAKPEHDYVCENFNYKNGEVCYTGLARYDALCDYQVKKQILVMPTWRVYLKNLKDDQFLSSNYFKKWHALLNNKRLLEFLDREEIDLIFYPHYEMQPYVTYFSSVGKRVKIADFDHYDVQTLLKESNLLITDYSSVFFDFSYMQKPSVYYQFDAEEFFSKHYQKGYFDYEKNGFGPVVKDAEILIDEILSICKEEFVLNKEYLARCENFFPLRDKDNCQRIFQEIERLKCK